MAQQAHAHTNRLIDETSPYLLQHAHNPVDWYPWGPEALERAKAEDKPIFLSIGYSACHWCHVMERECFENEEIAALMNKWFICIKVDREERPDIDDIYMRAVQALTGSGGWPMSVFLTPDLEPYYGGTYFPPEPKYGRPGFGEVVTGLGRAWKEDRENVITRGQQLAKQISTENVMTGEVKPNVLTKGAGRMLSNYDRRWGGFGQSPKFPHSMDLRVLLRHDREKVVEQAGKLTEHIGREGKARSVGDVAPNILELAFEALKQSYDPVWGGFGGAPKFLHTGELRVLLRHWLASGEREALAMATHTLDKMAAGGMYDQLGGGFHRYSTDEKWLIPHFEKMLYDNGLLIPVYLEGYLATGDENYARIVRGSCEWALREMLTDSGGFASTQDADSEGEEGKFFAWTPEELVEVLGAKHGAWAAAWYGVTDEGNFEHGTSALWRHQPAQQVADGLHIELDELEAAMNEARIKLFAHRDARVHPGTDDKILASWNGLMISALAQSYQVLGDPRFLDAARGAANYVLRDMRQEDGALFATARNGRAHLNAYLDDYAFMIQGLIDLYESDFDTRWLKEALALEGIVHARFLDKQHGGYFSTGNNHEKLIARLKSPQDGALPSGNGVQALNLMRLAELTGSPELAERAQNTIQSFGAGLNQYPQGFSQLLIAIDFAATGPREIVIAGEPTDPQTRAMLEAVRSRFLPQRVVALSGPNPDAELIPLLEGRPAPEVGARAFVCRDFVCKQPAETAEELAAQLDAE